ncbi:MAG TPA: hypothetical protein VFH29_05670, partial [Anaerolineales bacterium]|nr:hypothetical protein [Anaerolineales bacterium]
MQSDILRPTSPDERLNIVRRYIGDHMSEPLDREHLAHVAGFSVPHLQRLFAWHLGATVGQYVREA